MTTKLGNKIHPTTLGILYICKYTRNPFAIEVVSEYQFDDPGVALEYYANTPNPESQLASASTHEKLLSDLLVLHQKMGDDKWLEELDLYI